MGTTLTELKICSFSAVFKQIRYFASMLKLAVARCIATCTCVRLLHVHAGVPSIKDQFSWASERERSVVRLITPKILKEARRCELVLRDSFPFRWSASEGQAKWPVSADVTHRHPCWTDSKSFENPQLVWTGMWNLQWRSNGERQTNRARIKAPWTH